MNRCIMQEVPGRQSGVTTEECKRAAKINELLSRV